MSSSNRVPPLAEDQNLTPAAAAEWLCRSRRTLDNWRSQGRGPSYVRCGGRIVYSLHDLRSWRDAQRVEVTG